MTTDVATVGDTRRSTRDRRGEAHAWRVGASSPPARRLRSAALAAHELVISERWISVFECKSADQPLVLLHGIGSRWQVFGPLLDLLAGEFEVWALEMRGFGASLPAVQPVSSIGRLTDEARGCEARALRVSRRWQQHRWRRCARFGGARRGGVRRGAGADRFSSTRERAFCQMSVRSSRALARRLPDRALTAAVGAHAGPVVRPLRRTPGAHLGTGGARRRRRAHRRDPFGRRLQRITGYLAPTTAADRVTATVVWGDKDSCCCPASSSAPDGAACWRTTSSSRRGPPDDGRRSAGGR